MYSSGKYSGFRFSVAKYQGPAAVIALCILSACGGGQSQTTPAANATTDTTPLQTGAVQNTPDNQSTGLTEQNTVPPDQTTSRAVEISNPVETETTATAIDPATDSSDEVPVDISLTDSGASSGNVEVEDVDTGITPAVEAPPLINPVVERPGAPTENLTTEDRTWPAQGSVFSSDNKQLKSNGADLFSDSGNPPQRVDINRAASWPGLRYGNFLVSNNPWNSSAIGYTDWYQEISLFDTDNGYGVTFDWDLGARVDTHGSPFDTKSFPEVIYGTKSAFERSGTFQDTGLPVELSGVSEISIDYRYNYEAGQSQSPNATDTDSGFNVVVESFFHDSCDIRRAGLYTDNAVFEMMVWLKAGPFTPSGAAPQSVVTTSDGRSYNVYVSSFRYQFIAFVAQNELQDGTVRYSELVRHTQDFAADYEIYPLQDTDCMANIIMGTEIWHGSATFNLEKFQVNRNY